MTSIVFTYFVHVYTILDRHVYFGKDGIAKKSCISLGNLFNNILHLYDMLCFSVLSLVTIVSYVFFGDI